MRKTWKSFTTYKGDTTQSTHKNWGRRNCKQTTWNSGWTSHSTKTNVGWHPVSLGTPRLSIITLEPIWLVIRIIQGFMIKRYTRFRIIKIIIISNSSRRLVSIFMKIIVGILAWKGLRVRLCRFRIIIRTSNCRWKNGFRVYVILKNLWFWQS